MAQSGAGLVLPPKKALWLRQQQQMQVVAAEQELPSSEEKDSTSTSSTPPAAPSQPEKDMATTTTKLGPSRTKKRKRTELDFLQATDFSLGRSLGSRNTFTSVIVSCLDSIKRLRHSFAKKLTKMFV
ncbi:hypothetical protein QOT17_024557 [Balamuthia mandrillaris]